jgi:hypothetical protein
MITAAKLFEITDATALKHKSISELGYSQMYVITQLGPEKIDTLLAADGAYYTGKYIGSGLNGQTFNIGQGFHKRFDLGTGWYYYTYGNSS